MHTKRRTVALRVLALLLSVLLTAGTLSMGAFAEEASPFQGTSVTLASNLIVNFYVEVQDTAGAQMTFLVKDSGYKDHEETVPCLKAECVEGNLYKFSCELAPAQMNETVTATLSDSGKTYVKTTSVRQYAQNLFALRQWDKLAATDIMLATLNYGAAAQKYFEYNAENPANADYVRTPESTVPDAEPVGMEGSVDGISFYGGTLVFVSKVAVRFYFTGSVEGKTFKVGETTYTPRAKSGLYYVEIPEINPQDYNNNITLTVSNGTEEMSVTYSPMHYISRMYHKDGSSEAMKTLLSNLYEYHLQAVSYLNDIYGNQQDNVVAAQ